MIFVETLFDRQVMLQCILRQVNQPQHADNSSKVSKGSKSAMTRSLDHLDPARTEAKVVLT